jgi:hypothetical protein
MAVKGASKELSQLYRRLTDLGCEIALSRKNHVLVCYPNGRRSTYPLTSANRHTIKRLRLEIRRLENIPSGSL